MKTAVIILAIKFALDFYVVFDYLRFKRKMERRFERVFDRICAIDNNVHSCKYSYSVGNERLETLQGYMNARLQEIKGKISRLENIKNANSGEGTKGK